MANKVRQQQRSLRQAQAARQRRYQIIGIGVVSAVVLAGIVYYLVSTLSPTPVSGAPVSGTAVANATCGPIQNIPDEGNAHITPGETPTYQSIPPSSGAHNPNPLPAGIYSSPVDVTMEVHSEEHGYIIIHYNGITSGEINQLQQLVQRDPRKLILSPYPGMNYKVSLTAWDHLQTCNGVNEQAINSFVAEFRDKGPENVP